MHGPEGDPRGSRLSRSCSALAATATHPSLGGAAGGWCGAPSPPRSATSAPSTASRPPPRERARQRKRRRYGQLGRRGRLWWVAHTLVQVQLLRLEDAAKGLEGVGVAQGAAMRGRGCMQADGDGQRRRRQTVSGSGSDGGQCRKVAAALDRGWQRQYRRAAGNSGRKGTGGAAEGGWHRRTVDGKDATGGLWLARAAAVVQPERPWLCGGRAAAVGFHDCRMMTRIQDRDCRVGHKKIPREDIDRCRSRPRFLLRNRP